MKLNLNRISAILRQVAAVIAVVIGTAGASIDTLPTSVRAILVAAGGAVLTAEHVVAALQTPAP